MINILLIDDDPTVQDIFRAALNPTVRLDYCGSISEAKKFLLSKDYKLVVIDLFFDKEKSIDFLLDLKLKNPEILRRIIMITGKGEIDDEIEAHQFGILDYLKKPLNLKLLKAVVEKHLINNENQSFDVRTIGPFKVDLNEQSILLIDDGKIEKSLELTLKEYKILKLLIDNAGRVLSREKIMEIVWEESSDSLTRTVDMHISTLRKKIKPHSNLLETKRGVGYILNIG